MGLRHESGDMELIATLNPRLPVSCAPFHIPIKSQLNTDTDNLESRQLLISPGLLLPHVQPGPLSTKLQHLCGVTWPLTEVSPLTAHLH